MNISATLPPKKGRHLYKHGLVGHPLYSRWRGMIQRCTDKNCKAYPYYGGRGITVCERWKDFANFLSDMGMPDVGQTLDRVNSNGNYEPSNCAWVGRSEQMQNRRNSILIEHKGQKKCLAHWARDLGIHVATLKYRIQNGWPLDEALTSTIYSTNRKEKNVIPA